jgi:hypothetical protein
VEATNGQARIIYAPRAQNGYPERRNYVYRGTGEDIMPWAITDDGCTDYDVGMGLKSGPKSAAKSSNRCATCHLDYRNRKHLDECRR